MVKEMRFVSRLKIFRATFLSLQKIEYQNNFNKLNQMERQIILNALAGSLDPNPQMRKQAEAQLSEFAKQPGFTVYCLELAVDGQVPISQRSSAAVFFKNRIIGYWNVENDKSIKPEEQEVIKQKLIESLLKVHNDTHIRPQLTVSVRTIVSRHGWLLNEPITHLLSSKSDVSHIYIGLLLLYEATRALRFAYSDRTLIDSYIAQSFPILESIASEVLPKDDYHSGDILYLILKIFKFSSLNTLPVYFYDVNKLSTWISIHLSTIQKNVPEKILELEPSDRTLDKRIKCFKWAFGNLHKFYSRFGMPTSKNSSPEFIEYFNKNYVPEILKVYFQIIEKWSTGFWLSDFSLFHLISFIEKCIITPAWELIKPHFDIILRHLLFRCLCQENLELYEDDPEEYVRRYFDINRESKTADVAAVDALFVAVHHRFEELPLILTFLNEIFNTYSDQNEEGALKIEGGLRILSSISISLEKDESPVKDQIDQIIDGFIVPQLSSKYEFLRARSCETISIFSRSFVDKQILSKVFQAVYENFKNNESLPIQIEAADALKVLITDPLVTESISNEVPMIMQKLLNLSKSYELDAIAEVMEAFVERFSNELQPFAIDLGKNLADQFMRTATELIELQSSGKSSSDTSDADKEYQAVGYLNTMTTMIISMTKVDLEPVFIPVVQFVLTNAAVQFLGEVMELVESLTMNTKTISPAMWSIFKETIDSFDTFAIEYFEYYVPFYENIITYGFKDLNKTSPQVQLLSNTIQKLITSPISFDDQGAFELVEYQTLVLKEYDESQLVVILNNFKNEELSYGFVKVILSALYADASKTLQILESAGQTFRIFEFWFNISSFFENVYGLKLQILSLLSILSLPQLPPSIQNFVSELSNKLTVSIEKLPGAMKKRQDIFKGEIPYAEGEEFEEDIDDEFKDTPLDDINIFVTVKHGLLNIQANLPDTYNVIFQSLPEKRLDMINSILALQG